MDMKRETELLRKKPEKIRQKTIAPLKTDGEIRAKKVICHYEYYLNDGRGKWPPRVYLCEHRTMADIFLEAALFDPKKNILCISSAEWESSPEEVKKGLSRFEKIFREPYRASQNFVRRLFGARQAGKSILFPVTEDARGMDRDPCMDVEAIVRLCRKLEMPVCTITFRNEEIEKKDEREQFYLDVKPLFGPEELGNTTKREAEAAVSESFLKENDSTKSEDFGERKRLMLRGFLKSELHVEVPVEICQCHVAGKSGETGDHGAPETGDEGGTQEAGSVLRVDMTGITLETAGACFHRNPGALKSLAIYPGKMPGTGERGTILIYPHYDRTFYLFTMQKEDAVNIQAAAEEMYRIVLSQ